MANFPAPSIGGLIVLRLLQENSNGGPGIPANLNRHYADLDYEPLIDALMKGRTTIATEGVQIGDTRAPADPLAPVLERCIDPGRLVHGRALELYNGDPASQYADAGPPAGTFHGSLIMSGVDTQMDGAWIGQNMLVHASGYKDDVATDFPFTAPSMTNAAIISPKTTVPTFIVTAPDPSLIPAGYDGVNKPGRVGMGLADFVPTALLELAGNPNTDQLSAPLKVRMAGATLMPVPEAGAFESDGSDFYLTDGAGVRSQISTGGAGILLQGALPGISQVGFGHISGDFRADGALSTVNLELFDGDATAPPVFISTDDPSQFLAINGDNQFPGIRFDDTGIELNTDQAWFEMRDSGSAEADGRLDLALINAGSIADTVDGIIHIEGDGSARLETPTIRMQSAAAVDEVYLDSRGVGDLRLTAPAVDFKSLIFESDAAGQGVALKYNGNALLQLRDGGDTVFADLDLRTMVVEDLAVPAATTAGRYSSVLGRPIYSDGVSNFDLLSSEPVAPVVVALAAHSIPATQASDATVALTVGATTVSLPAIAAVSDGWKVVIKDRDSLATATPHTVDTPGAELIDGAATASLATNQDALTIQRVGLNWATI